MANSFYNVTGSPVTGSAGASAVIRSEYAAIASGFDKMPALTTGTAIIVNSTGTALTNTVGTLALAGNFATTGAFATTFAQSANITLTLPGTSDTLVGRATTDTLTNKTLTAPVISTIVNTGTLTLPTSTDTLVGRATTDTLTNKTLTSPTINGGTHTAITSLGIRSTGAAFDLTLATTEILTAGRTLSVVVGDAARTLTLTGSPSISGATITGAGTLATTTGKTATFSNSLTFAGTDGKTATFSNSLTFAGTDSTTMTFPSTSATIARTDAANTFTGHQTIEGVTSTGATGTGNLVFNSGPTISLANVNPAVEGTVVAASTTDLSTSTANRQSVTGNTTITGFGTGANLTRIIRFTGTPLLTYNATSLITPSGANIQAAPGDVATLSSDGSGNWRITDYLPYGGTLTASASAVSCATTGAAIASVALTPGKWLLLGTTVYNGSSSNASATAAINATSGSAVGTSGLNQIYFVNYTTNGVGSGAIHYVVTITTNTTYYLNAAPNSSTANFDGSIIAKRIF